MRWSGGSMSHKKHRSCGLWGTMARSARLKNEVNRLAGGDRKPQQRTEPMFPSMSELMRRRRR